MGRREVGQQSDSGTVEGNRTWPCPVWLKPEMEQIATTPKRAGPLVNRNLNFIRPSVSTYSRE
jgi:hypothetical protein